MAQIYWPFPTSRVSEWPGTRPQGWANHVGTDFAVPQGTPLLATMAGTVDIHWNDGLGAWVIDIINHDGTVVRNGHMSHMAVNDGHVVKVGDYLGNTGGAPGTPGAGLSTGPHLHWELRNNTGWGPSGWYDHRNLSILDLPTNGNPGGEEEMNDAERKKLNEIHAALWQITDPKNGLVAKLNARVTALDSKVSKLPAATAKATLDTEVKRTGTDKDGKPRTGTSSLRKLLGAWEYQVGLSRRILENIVVMLTPKDRE